MKNLWSVTELQTKEAGKAAPCTRHKLERQQWGALAGAGCTREGWRLFEVLRARLRCSVRAPGSAVVWVLLGFTVQRHRKLGFMDPAAHSIVWPSFNTDFFSEMPIRAVLGSGLRDNQTPGCLTHIQPFPPQPERSNLKEKNLFSVSSHDKSCPPALLSKPATFSSS